MPWRAALGISSGGGGYVMEYIFFVMFSVGALPLRYFFLQSLTVLLGCFRVMCLHISPKLRSVC